MKLRASCECVYKFVAIRCQTHLRTALIFEYKTPSRTLPVAPLRSTSRLFIHALRFVAFLVCVCAVLASI